MLAMTLVCALAPVLAFGVIDPEPEAGAKDRFTVEGVSPTLSFESWPASMA